ncbi:MAG: hypothetical protein WDW36_005381 [Sanguina aurantia]
MVSSASMLVVLTTLLAVASRTHAIRYIVAEQRVDSSSEGFSATEHTTSMLDENGQPWSSIDSTASKSSLAIIPSVTPTGRDSLVSIVKRTVSQWLYKGEELVGFRTSDTYEMQQIASQAVTTAESIPKTVTSNAESSVAPTSGYETLTASALAEISEAVAQGYESQGEEVVSITLLELADIPEAAAEEVSSQQDVGSITLELLTLAGSDSEFDAYAEEEEVAYTESYDDEFIAALEDLDFQMILLDKQLQGQVLAKATGASDAQDVQQVEGGQVVAEGEVADGKEERVFDNKLQMKGQSAEGDKKAASRSWFGW